MNTMTCIQYKRTIVLEVTLPLLSYPYDCLRKVFIFDHGLRFSNFLAPQIMRGRKYTREEILAGIKEAYEKGYDLRHSKVQKSSYRNFYRSEMLPKYFGNWKGAIAAAGILYTEFGARIKEQARQKYLEELAQAYTNGVDLNASALQKKGNPNNGIYYRAQRFYKGRLFWENALTDAKLPVDKIVRQHMWDEEKVKERLLQRYTQGKELHSTKVMHEQNDLYHAMCNHFGSYDDALKYAGFDPDKIRKTRKPYTKNEVINTVKAMHAEGKDLNESRIDAGDDVKLKRIVDAAQHRFGSWEKAVEMAGIDYGAYRIRERGWNEAKVLDRIKDLQSRNEPLNSGHISNKRSGLYHAAYRYAGGWEAAVTSCGIDYKAISKKQGISLSREEIIGYIRELHRKRHGLNASSITSDKYVSVKRLYRQSRTKFGGWDNALEEAGFDHNKIRKMRPKYALSELVKIVRNLRSNGVRIEQEYIRNDKQNEKYYSAVTRRMKWGDFLKKVGPRTLAQELALLAKGSPKFKSPNTLGVRIYGIAKTYHKTTDEVWNKYHRITHGKKGDAETDAKEDYYRSAQESKDEGENS